MKSDTKLRLCLWLEYKVLPPFKGRYPPASGAWMTWGQAFVIRLIMWIDRRNRYRWMSGDDFGPKDPYTHLSFPHTSWRDNRDDFGPPQ
jgi:hypothetical protein